MGMLKDALGPAMGAGQANNGLNGVMSKVKGMFGQKNDSSTPENWRAPSPAPLPDLDEPRSSRNYVRRDDSEDEDDDLPPPYDSRREGPEPRADRRVLATPQAYEEYDPSARSPRRMGEDDRTLRPRPPFEQYGPPQGQQPWGQGPDMGPPLGAYGSEEIVEIGEEGGICSKVEGMEGEVMVMEEEGGTADAGPTVEWEV
ncbi:hypothetical protein PRZ48_008493 [Zasmidium cellare]|uniref:Uncharacterized protein n=1 Tax=Zasmidium cellare TaxID=395010 RepID=A0ABR0EFM6_ZASCE|nr:hypothetical protein PRZ48_008493 [Zasmidium cellare]